jgi:VWFA-related protein
MRRQTLSVLAFLATPLFAQSPLIEKIDVLVVNVDVTVTDRAGRPVHGLTRDDFEIFEDGKPQAVTNFYQVSAGKTPHTVPAAAIEEEDPRFRRKVLVLIDAYSMTPYDRNRALGHLEQFINDRFRGGEYDWSIGSIDTGLRMLLAPTSDKQAIHEALNQIRKGHAPRLPTGADKPLSLQLRDPFADDSELWQATVAGMASVDAIAEATRAFAATSGKKIILLLTSQLLPNDWNMPNLALSKQITLTRNRLVWEANASNVNFYIINPEGVAGSDPSMYWIARQTGGRLMAGNNLEESLRQFDLGSSNFYSLGYQPNHADDGKYHRIEVRVKKGNYALQYREGYSSLPGAQQVDRTLGSTFGSFMISASSIPVTIAFEEPRKTDDGVIVPMKTVVPTDRLLFLPSGDTSTGHVDIYISIFDGAGHNVWFVHLLRDARIPKGESQSGTFNETTEMHFLKGKPYRVVVAVRDQITEAVGVTQQLVRF